ncbi:MAG: aromatic acid exporter family protein [Lachnospiraceae bacterium]
MPQAMIEVRKGGMKNKGVGIMGKESIIKTIKIAIGSTVAIILADLLGLEYIPSAGIITLLTIQNTKKATLKLALIRVISFVGTIGLLTILLAFIDNHILVHGVFMLIMIGASYKMKWQDAISVNATVGGQALILARDINSHFILNEAALVGLGIVIAVILNLKMPNKEKEIQDNIHQIENDLKALLKSIALHLHKKDRLKKDRKQITELIETINNTLDKALEYEENTLKDYSRYYMEYLIMRRNQCVVLIHFYRSVASLDEIPAEADIVGAFLVKMSEEFNVRNNPTKRLEQLKEISKYLDQLPLPESKIEFNGRAIMYQIVNEVEEFLRLKKEFTKNLTDDQLKVYWTDKN